MTNTSPVQQEDFYYQGAISSSHLNPEITGTPESQEGDTGIHQSSTDTSQHNSQSDQLSIDDLLLQLPILIKLKVQVPMSLFSINTSRVPLDTETYAGDKREYTQIILETELIALTDTNYVPLT